MPGQPITFTIRVTNVGDGPTSGTVTVMEEPPASLTITSLVWHRLDLRHRNADVPSH